jgi:hypothetical protein
MDTADTVELVRAAAARANLALDRLAEKIETGTTATLDRRNITVDIIVHERRVLEENGGATTRHTCLAGTATPLPADVQTCAECADRLVLVYTIPCPAKCCDVELCLNCAASHGYPLD